MLGVKTINLFLLQKFQVLSLFYSTSSVQLAKPVHIQVTQAEELWSFKLAEPDWSFRSCDVIDRLFHRMF